ncbi:MAG: peptidoglycan DD-metalloendopeptidase family protein [Clostridia bacterium]|nr:peptidoglycan DD-metalloendopeptidase family protein [Clostridia bacterium]
MQYSIKNRLVAVGLTLGMVFATVFSVGSVAKVQFENEEDAAAYEEAQDELADLNAERKQLAKELAAAKNEKNSLLKQKEILEYQVLSTDAEIVTLNWVIADLTARLERKNSELAEAEGEYSEFYEKYKSRIRASYEAGDVSYIEVILTSANFSDLLTRIDFVSDMMEYDKYLLDEMKDSIDFIEDTKASIEKELKIQEDALIQLELLKAEQESQVLELSSTVEAINDEISDIEDEESKFLRLEKELDAKIQNLLDRQKKYVGGDIIWPLPAEYDHITSGYGYRNFDKSFHDAIDIAAPGGTPIYAVNDGTIIMYQWVNTGGGNKVVIDHGSSITTTYCHLSKFQEGLKVGSEVKQGDIIGYVGTTGTSTGNHLHFRIAIDGSTVDPRDYVNAQGKEPAKKLEW